MAQPIQDPTVGMALQALFKLQGRVRPALEEFVLPTVVVASIAENSPPAAAGAAVLRFAQGAVAGEYGTWRFEVPGGSFAEVTRLTGQIGANGFIRLHFPGNAATIGPLAHTANKGFIDGRIINARGQPASVLTYSTQAAALGSYEWVYPVTANQTFSIDMPQGLIVGTGDESTFGFLEGQFSAVNTAIYSMSLWWREYAVP